MNDPAQHTQSQQTQSDPKTAGQVRRRRVSLKPLLEFEVAEWRVLYSFFRDRELADWNDAKPIKIPEWLFKKVMQDEEKTGERIGFGVLDEHGELIGNAELYDFHPTAPYPASIATMGIMIGYPKLWGQGYGKEAVQALIEWAFVTRPTPLKRIRLTTFGHNKRAQRAFSACGFKEVGRSVQPNRTDVHMELQYDEWHKVNMGNKG